MNKRDNETFLQLAERLLTPENMTEYGLQENYFLRFCMTQITAQAAEMMPHRVLISRLIINLKYLLSVFHT